MTTQVINSTSEALGTAEKTTADVQAKTGARILFIDNIRIFLTILVVVHHLMIIYAGSGGWIYKEGREDVVTSALGSWFTAVNHAYFMGLFLLVAAYFVPGSYDRKGAARFIKDRLVRLGIPLAVYSWLVRPLFLYAGLASYQGLQLPLPTWYAQRYFRDYGLIGGGPLWFIEALLIFSILYALWRLFTSSRPSKPAGEIPFPGQWAIALCALLIGLASFFVRQWFPSDVVYRPLNLQLADFSQYIVLFILGTAAYRNNWLTRLPERSGRAWLAIGVFLILMYPPIAIWGGAIEDATPFKGGWHWQALLAALWQAYLGLAMCISVIYIFGRRLNHQGRLGSFLSRNAYTVYLIHEPVITLAALLAIPLTIYPLLKFVLAALVTLPVCLGLSHLIRRLPYTQRVLG